MPRRLTAILDTPRTCAVFSCSDSMARILTGRPAGASSSSSPARTVPAGSVPVTTVPLPVMLNTRSTHSRTGAAGSGVGSPAASSASAVRSSGRPWPVTALTAIAGSRAEAGPPDLVDGPARGRPGIGEVGPRHRQQPAGDAQRVDRGQVLGGLRHPAAVGGHHEQHRRHRSDSGQHVRHEPLVSGHVHKRQPLTARQRQPGEAQVDGQAAAALFGPAVGLHPGQRPHQGRLAVIHVPRGGDDLHGS